MSPEEKDYGSESSGIAKQGLDFLKMDEETIKEKKRQVAPAFGLEEDSEELENVVHTPFEDFLLVKHEGVFHMVQFQEGGAQVIPWDTVWTMPKLKKWSTDYFD
jgi:hypothetical protein